VIEKSKFDGYTDKFLLDLESSSDLESDGVTLSKYVGDTSIGTKTHYDEVSPETY
jgi:hypothetical protein